MTDPDLEQFLVTKYTTLRQAMQAIDRNAQGIVLVVDPDRRLLATLTDGDIRRAILQAINLDDPVESLLSVQEKQFPVTAPAGSNDHEIAKLMQAHSIRQVPMLDAGQRVVALRCREQIPLAPGAIRAVVMAGGFGKRLRPLTEHLPKPLLPIGDRPLLQHTIEQLCAAGFHQVSITTHFKGELIRDHFGGGEDYGVAIDYVSEDIPLGTAGALALLDPPTEPVLVINGDILTRLDFRSMRDFHFRQNAVMTVGITRYDQQVPYGVVELQGAQILNIKEKPVSNFFILGGIYLIGPEAWQFLRRGERCDMPDLIRLLIAAGRKVVSFPIAEYWLDIGQMKDYERALADVAGGRF